MLSTAVTPDSLLMLMLLLMGLFWIQWIDHAVPSRSPTRTHSTNEYIFSMNSFLPSLFFSWLFIFIFSISAFGFNYLVLLLWVVFSWVECVFSARSGQLYFISILKSGPYWYCSTTKEKSKCKPIKIEKSPTLWVDIFFQNAFFALSWRPALTLEIRNVWPISECDWITAQVANSITPLNSFGQKSSGRRVVTLADSALFTGELCFNFIVVVAAAAAVRTLV